MFKNGEQLELESNEIKSEKKSESIKSFKDHESIFKERTGNEFTFFYKKYYPKLIYYTSKMCGDQQKAEDVTTESFMTAFEKVEKYERDKAQFSTWLFTIARNIMLQDIKSSKKTMSIDVELDGEGTTLKDFIPEDEDDSYILELSAKKAEIMKNHISDLKEPYRKVIQMREIEKMAYKDIADILGKNLSTIKSQIRNGRAILITNSKREFDILDEMYM
jgi:RNA polymerase sigma-70 factor (ECF subfamily)